MTVETVLPAPTVEPVPLAELRPHPQNYREHPADQLQHIKASLRAHGFYRNVVAANDGTILAGHGVVMAAAELGLETVPVIRLPLGPDDPRALQVLIGDNEIPHLGRQDDRLLAELLAGLGAVDAEALLGTGYDPEALERLASQAGILPQDEPAYTQAIESPIYEPTGPKPEPGELYEEGATEALVEAIRGAEGLTEDVRAFLVAAAHRHTVFHFGKIAEYYAQADAQVQALMEQSGLVIIDFQQAIELGYVRLGDRIAELYGQEHPDA